MQREVETREETIALLKSANKELRRPSKHLASPSSPLQEGESDISMSEEQGSQRKRALWNQPDSGFDLDEGKG